MASYGRLLWLWLIIPGYGKLRLALVGNEWRLVAMAGLVRYDCLFWLWLTIIRNY